MEGQIWLINHNWSADLHTPIHPLPWPLAQTCNLEEWVQIPPWLLAGKLDGIMKCKEVSYFLYVVYIYTSYCSCCWSHYLVRITLNWYLLVITKGYGVQATTVKGKNAFAPTLCFAQVSSDRWSKHVRSDYEW